MLSFKEYHDNLQDDEETEVNPDETTEITAKGMKDGKLVTVKWSNGSFLDSDPKYMPELEELKTDYLAVGTYVPKMDSAYKAVYVIRKFFNGNEPTIEYNGAEPTIPEQH